jgi:2-polyprenyl-6-methoxyphenol hydroxylase-like FAD-dependent oxidoreductase
MHDVLIAGSGICGMSAALSLAHSGRSVTILERDSPPPSGDIDAAFFSWNRNGAAQFRHPHAFLGLLCNLLEQHYPDLLQEFYAAGARRVNFQEMLPAQLRENYTPAKQDEALWVLMCRRATIETVMRRFVARQANIKIINHARVTGLLAETSTNGLRVEGLQVDVDGAQQQLPANIVVDASGRRSRFPRWFEQMDAPISEEKAGAEIVYYTRHYQLCEGRHEPPRGERSGAGDLGYLKFGVFPGENGHFAIILCVPVAEVALKRAVRDPQQFDNICLNIPGLQPWLTDHRARATTRPFGIGDITAVWRDYLTNDEPVALNFFAIGDAAVRTNPLYGRGCSMSVLHANLLADTLADVTDPVTRAQVFSQRTEQALRPIWNASLREDRRGIRRSTASMQGLLLESPNSLRQWLRLAFGDALAAAVREQLHVARGAFRTFHLLEKPGAFLADWRVRGTLLRYLLRGRRRNAARRLQPGPNRQAMHAALDLPATEAPIPDN